MCVVDRVLSALVDGIETSASRRARGDPSLVEDLIQEATLSALGAINKHRDKPFHEVVLIAGRSAQNRMTDIIRRRIRDPHESDGLFLERNTESTQVEDLVARELVQLLRSRLSPLARRVFDESLEPGEEVLAAAEKAKRRTLIVNDSRIAEGIGVSKATVSRARSEIHREALEIWPSGPEQSPD